MGTILSRARQHHISSNTLFSDQISEFTVSEHGRVKDEKIKRSKKGPKVTGGPLTCAICDEIWDNGETGDRVEVLPCDCKLHSGMYSDI